MWRTLIILIALLWQAAPASITAAWKVPIHQFIPDLRVDERVRKLGEAPGASAFLLAGEELWDISAALPSGGLEGDPKEKSEVEWIVWSPRSGMVVARGTPRQIRQVEDRTGLRTLPTAMRVRFEILGGKGGEEDRILSWLSFGGGKGLASVEGLSLEVECSGGRGEWIGMSWRATLPGAQANSVWTANSSVVMRDGKRAILARYGQDGERREIYATVTRESANGIPVAGARWLERAGGVESWPFRFPSHAPVMERLDEALSIGIYPVPPDFMERLTQLGAADHSLEQDPFSADQARGRLPDRSFIEAPESVAKWVIGDLIDAREALWLNGVDLKGEKTFAGYDPEDSKLVIVADNKIHDLIDQVTATTGLDRPDFFWVETNPESGGWGLRCGLGAPSKLCREGSGAPELVFEIAPRRGAGDSIVDLSYAIDVVVGAESLGRSVSRSSLILGQARNLGSFQMGAQMETDLILTVSKAAD